MRRALPILALLLAGCTGNYAVPRQPVTVTGPDGQQHGAHVSGSLVVELDATSTPAPPTAVPLTQTPVVVVQTATVVSVTQTPVIVVQTPTAVPAAMHEGVPLCSGHDRTRWHALVERNADNSIACTYAHEHHDNPTSVNDIFGEVGAWYGGTQEISYVWETVGAAGSENAVKHEGYKWFVHRDIPCVPASDRLENEGCIRAFRVQAHALGTVADATVRLHSYSVEMLVDYKGQQGIVRHGGHVDIGHLALAVDGGGGAFVCPALESNPASFTCGRGNQRRHSSANAEPEHRSHAAYTAGWYGDALTTFIEEWGPIDYDNPSNQLFFGPDANNSRGRVENLGAEARQKWMRPYATAPFGMGAVVNVQGYRDRGSAPGSSLSTSCTAPSIACWPLSYEQVAYGAYFLQANMIPQVREQYEHDVSSPATGRSLIRFPN